MFQVEVELSEQTLTMREPMAKEWKEYRGAIGSLKGLHEGSDLTDDSADAICGEPMVKIFALLCGVEESLIEELPLSDFVKLYQTFLKVGKALPGGQK